MLEPEQKGYVLVLACSPRVELKVGPCRAGTARTASG